MDSFSRSFSSHLLPSAPDFSSTTLANDYQLEENSLDRYTIDNDESLSDSILRPLKELNNSSSLNFADRFLGDDGTVKVVKALLEDDRALATLDLRGNRISTAGIQALSQLLTKNTELKSLCLEWNSLGDVVSDINVLTEALAINTTLTHLDLRNNQLSPQSGAHLAKMLSINSTLKTLDLRWNSIDDSAAEQLENAVKQNSNSSLKQLLLLGNCVSPQLVSRIESLCAGQPDSTTLMISRETIEETKSSMPALPKHVGIPKTMKTSVADMEELQSALRKIVNLECQLEAERAQSRRLEPQHLESIAKLAKAEERIAGLNAQLSTDQKHAADRVETIRREAEDKQAQMRADSTREVEQLRDRAAQELEKLRSELNIQIDRVRHNALDQATAFQKSMEKLQQELVEANAQKSKALNDLHLAKEALSTTEARSHATHFALRSRQTELQAQNSDLSTECESLHKQNQMLQQRMDALEGNFSEAREKATKEMSECMLKHEKHVETIRTQYQENIQSLKEKAFDDAQKASAHFHKVKQELEESSYKEISSLKIQLQEEKNLVQDLKAQVTSLQSTLANEKLQSRELLQNTKQSMAEQAARTLKNVETNYSSEIAQLKTRAEQTAQQHRSEVQSLESTVAETQQQIAEKVRALEQSKQEYAISEQNRKELSSKLQSTQQQLDLAREQLESQRASFDHQISALTKEQSSERKEWQIQRQKLETSIAESAKQMAAKRRAHAHQQQMHYKNLKDMQQKIEENVTAQFRKVEDQLNIMFTSDLS